MQELNKQNGTWKWGLLCLFFLAPFFFLSYGFSNQYAAHLAQVSVIVFDWEKHIPLWPWTIIPYWSIDLFYGLSLLLCWNTFELKQHVSRLLLAQVISISCFLIFPLKFSFDRPEISGFFGIWFDVLMGFDQPYNQAPSLHIVLLVILWDFYRRHTLKFFKYGVDLWSIFIGISVLTTWQHHFIDIPTGLIVGAVCLWIFPISVESPFEKNAEQRLTAKHVKLASYYMIGSVMLFLIAITFKNIFLWLLYPSLSIFLVALSYVLVRPHFFQKQLNGHFSHASLILFAPYLIIARLNSLLWTHVHPEDSLIIQINQCEIFLGRIPTQTHSQHYHALFDCCTELPINVSNTDVKHYQQYLTLDLIPLQADQLQQAVKIFDDMFMQLKADEQITHKQLLIFCALGYSRSTSVLCAWLVKNQHVPSVLDAIQLIKKVRPWIVLNDKQIQQLNLFILKTKGLAP